LYNRALVNTRSTPDTDLILNEKDNGCKGENETWPVKIKATIKTSQDAFDFKDTEVFVFLLASKWGSGCFDWR